MVPGAHSGVRRNAEIDGCEVIQPTRRGFLLGLLAAPLIVRASSLMAVKPVHATGGYIGVHGYNEYGETIYEEYRPADLSQVSLERVLTEWHTHERRLSVGDNQLLIVVPPDPQRQARRLIGS